MICESTFFRHQKRYLIPHVLNVWSEQESNLVAEARERGNLELQGDGRCDSPGHSATYGTYSVIDSGVNKVIATETVKVLLQT